MPSPPQWVSIQPGFSPMKLFARPAPTACSHKDWAQKHFTQLFSISFADIASKLRIDTAQDASTCARRLFVMVIEATLNHDNGCLESNTSGNVYSTTLPQEQFHQRIDFCLSVHNDAVRSMLLQRVTRTRLMKSGRKKRRRLRKRTRAFKLKPLMGVLMMKMTLWKRIDQSHPRAYFF